MGSPRECELVLVADKSRKYTVQDFIHCLRSLGIQPGDTVCVHSQLLSLGKPLLPKEELLSAIVDALQKTIGEEGTLLMPAFSYSFCKNEVFHVETSESDVGILTEYFRKRPDTKRTRHPIFSFSVWGKRTQEFLDLPVTSFTEESVYGRLKNGNDKLVLLGAPLGYTFYYLAEEKLQVSHRYYKSFSGLVEQSGQYEKMQVPYYVRKLDQRSTESERKINEYLFSRGLQKKAPFGKGSITVAEMKPVYEALLDKLKEDETYFLRENEAIL